MAKCIITGCTLARPGARVHGDLWEEGGCFIFNAVLNHHKGPAQGEAAWEYDEDTQDDKVLTINYDNYFERRGVIVVSKAYATLSAVAQRYVYD